MLQERPGSADDSLLIDNKSSEFTGTMAATSQDQQNMIHWQQQYWTGQSQRERGIDRDADDDDDCRAGRVSDWQTLGVYWHQIVNGRYCTAR